MEPDALQKVRLTTRLKETDTTLLKAEEETNFIPFGKGLLCGSVATS